MDIFQWIIAEKHFSGTCTHTEFTSGFTWWQLRFYSKVQVDKIAIWNRNKDGKKIARRIDQTQVNS